MPPRSDALRGAPCTATENSLVAWSDEGEDSIALCAACGYSAASMELAVAKASDAGIADPEGGLAPEPLEAPGRESMRKWLVSRLARSAQMKSLVLVAHDAPILVMLAETVN